MGWINFRWYERDSMIEKIYIVWHKKEQRNRLISKIESMFDIKDNCPIPGQGGTE